MVPQCYILLCSCVYGLQQNGRLNKSCPFVMLPVLVMFYNLKQKIGKMDVTAILN